MNRTKSRSTVFNPAVLRLKINSKKEIRTKLQPSIFKALPPASCYRASLTTRQTQLPRVTRSSSQAHFDNSALIKNQIRRKWMRKSGKKVDFQSAEISKLKHFFDQLDQKKEGYLGCGQLLLPLLSLGFIESRKSLEDFIFKIDDDGLIHFQQFLKIVGSKGDSKNNILVQFFKDLVKDRIGGQKVLTALPFNIIIDRIRRQKIKDGLFSSDQAKRLQGLQVIRSYMFKLQQDNIYVPTQTELSLISSAIDSCLPASVK